MSSKKFSLIAVACENMGIGSKGSLSWRLKNELKYFNQQTTKTIDGSKKNALIMGRKTYFGIPESKRPLPGRLNIHAVSAVEIQNGKCRGLSNVASFSYKEALKCALRRELLSDPVLSEGIEYIWIVGGHTVYKEAMDSPLCHRVYLTEIMATYDCDAFFPAIPDDFQLVSNDDGLPSDIQEENGIKYQYKIYEKL